MSIFYVTIMMIDYQINYAIIPLLEYTQVASADRQFSD
jgi:hypothetical protein